MNFYCVGVLDGEGEDDRRTARIIHNANLTAMNAVRMQGGQVEDRFYRSIEEYMPEHWRQVNIVVQTWDQQSKSLGF